MRYLRTNNTTTKNYLNYLTDNQIDKINTKVVLSSLR